MARKDTQQTSRYETRQAVHNAALVLDTETDVFREESGLTAQQWQAVAMLVSGKKGTEVAEALGVTQETVSRWRNGPLFVAALNLAVRDAYTATIGEVRDITRDAFAALRECLYGEDDRTRLAAALAIVRLHLQLDSGALSLPTTPAAVAQEEKRKELFQSISF